MINSVKENPIQTIGASVALCLLVWIGSSLQTATTDIAVLKVQIMNLQSKIDDQNKNLYTQQDAARDFSNRDQLIQILRDRVTQLENLKKK